MRDFKRDLARMFPGYPWVESQSPLSVCLGDIQDAALVIEPTDDPSEHLTVQNDTVKILRVTPSNIVFLESYNSNRVAMYVLLDYSLLSFMTICFMRHQCTWAANTRQ